MTGNATSGGAFADVVAVAPLKPAQPKPAIAINAAAAADARVFFIVVNLPRWFAMVCARVVSTQSLRFGVIMPPNVEHVF